jgi:hypothetical protein
MQRIYIPVGVTLVLLATLTVVEANFSDRWSETNVSAEEFGKRFENLPRELEGGWIGTDNEVKDETLDVAGAVNHVSRTYENAETGERVDVWMIVGHARDIGRHTPDVCYPSQGFAQDGDKMKQTVEAPGEEPATFFTARFRRENMPGTPTRVFWAWNANESPEDAWEAPGNTRLRFGNNKALYKLYFTSSMSDRNQPIAQNTGYRFARKMLPVINRTLWPERYGIKPGEVAAAAAKAAAVATPDEEDAEATEANAANAVDLADPAASEIDPAAVQAPATAETPTP